jgi:hypothetical protein
MYKLARWPGIKIVRNEGTLIHNLASDFPTSTVVAHTRSSHSYIISTLHFAVIKPAHQAEQALQLHQSHRSSLSSQVRHHTPFASTPSSPSARGPFCYQTQN